MANKKISELTPKGSALSATDLLEVSVDAGGGTYTTASITGQEIKDFAGGSGNPSVISASYANGTVVTTTLVETVSQSLLIPANTFTDGMLDVLCRMTKTGSLGTTTFKIYKNTSNTLTGATLLSTIASSSSATNLFLQGIRNYRINTNTISGLSNTAASLTDYSIGSLTSSTTFTTTVDNYILFTLQLSNIADSANVSMARLTQYA